MSVWRMVKSQRNGETSDQFWKLFCWDFAFFAENRKEIKVKVFEKNRSVNGRITFFTGKVCQIDTSYGWESRHILLKRNTIYLLSYLSRNEKDIKHSVSYTRNHTNIEYYINILQVPYSLMQA